MGCASSSMSAEESRRVAQMEDSLVLLEKRFADVSRGRAGVFVDRVFSGSVRFRRTCLSSAFKRILLVAQRNALSSNSVKRVWVHALDRLQMQSQTMMYAGVMAFVSFAAKRVAAAAAEETVQVQLRLEAEKERRAASDQLKGLAKSAAGGPGSVEGDAAAAKFAEEKSKLVMDRDMAHTQLRNVKQQLAKAQAELEMAQGASAAASVASAPPLEGSTTTMGRDPES